MWTAEQVNIESTFHYTPFYQTEDLKYLVFLLGAFLCVANKIIIDFVFILLKAEPKDKMNIELLTQKVNKTNADT